MIPASARSDSHKGLIARFAFLMMARAASSLPVPLSPNSRHGRIGGRDLSNKL